MKKRYIVSALLISISFFSCKKEAEQVAPPTPTYKVVQIGTSSTTLLAEYPTSLEGITDIDIRAKVDGYIEKIKQNQRQQ